MKPIIFTLLLLSTGSMAKPARTIYMTDKKTELIIVPVGKTTVLSFPSKPHKVIVGNQGLFGVEYVENDLAISPLKSNARSNLFVYLEGRRFGFNLNADSQGGDEIVVIRDVDQKNLKVRVKQ